MVWSRLDDGWHDDPKIMAAGPEARALHVTAINYCSKHLTDGVLSEPVAVHLAGMCVVTSTATELLDRMVEHTLFDCEIDGDAVIYRVHNFLAYHPTKVQVEVDREQRHADKVAGGLASAKSRREKFGTADPRANAEQEREQAPEQAFTPLLEQVVNPVPDPPRPDLDPLVRGTTNKVSLRQGVQVRGTATGELP